MANVDTAGGLFSVVAVCGHSTEKLAGSTEEVICILQGAIPALCPPLPQPLP